MVGRIVRSVFVYATHTKHTCNALLKPELELKCGCTILVLAEACDMMTENKSEMQVTNVILPTWLRHPVFSVCIKFGANICNNSQVMAKNVIVNMAATTILDFVGYEF